MKIFIDINHFNDKICERGESRRPLVRRLDRQVVQLLQLVVKPAGNSYRAGLIVDLEMFLFSLLLHQRVLDLATL